MAKKMLLMMLGFSLLIGGFWAGQAQDPQMPRTDPPTVPATQTDLSGTYAGTFDCEALGLTGDTTLTITGNEFTTADGKSGRIVASTTGGYTAVAMQVGGTEPTATPTIISLRARKSGNRLTLSAVSGGAQKCTFTTARIARGRRNQRTPAATGTEVANPAMPTESPAPVTPTESPIPEQTPSPVPSPTPIPSPTPMPTPVPNPSPSPSPSPTPFPSPGDPTPSPTPGEPQPSPTATPSPTPTPSPSPRLR